MNNLHHQFKHHQLPFFMLLTLALTLFSCQILYAAPIAHNFWQDQLSRFSEENKIDTEIIVTSSRLGSPEFSNVNLLLSQNKSQEVIKLANDVLSKEPGSGLAYEVLGTAMFMEGNLSEAIQAFKQAQKLDPMQSGPLTKQGIIYMEQGEIDIAEQLLIHAIELNSKDRTAHQRLGLLYEYKKNYDQAIVHLKKGIAETSADYLGVSVNLANILNQRNNSQEAINILEPRLPLTATIAEAHLILATSYLQLQLFDKALTRFKRASELMPLSAGAKLGTALALKQMGKVSAAISVLKNLIKDKPDWIPGIIELGKAQLANDEPDAASESFKKAEKLGTSTTTIQKIYAEYYLSTKRFSKALDIYEQMIDGNGGEPNTYVTLAELYQAKAEHGSGINILKQAIEKYPDNSYLLFRLGSYLGTLGQYQEAIEYLQKAADLAPESIPILKALNMAQVKAKAVNPAVATAKKLYELLPDQSLEAVNYASRLQDANRKEDAENIYRKALLTFPDNPIIKNNYASFLVNQHKFKEAEPYAIAANNITKGKNPFIIDTLGWVNFHLGKEKEALDLLNRATLALPSQGSFQYHKGIVLKARGKQEEAIIALEKALSLTPNAEWKPKAEQELEKLSSR